ncbi:Ger(x)C family germination protein [Paenibacillus castaneae]|uniref:Ger(x)C family spore germination protein n=1 Tax=Paenibacillus castaneae TaxID=474957 RepID=UPI001FD1FF67|nr:Ger(x)C family spore germination protein [Paenibacillus castaneae]NIK75817.1 Ger(x)C family germination protein [Paenibacillus castaneae]
MTRLLRRSVILLTGFSLLLSGCWDIREIQDIEYITAIGIDYRDGKYIIYAQMLDFSSVAKQESGKSSQPTPVWVGQGRGATLADALINIYKTNQQQMSWGQVTALVLTKPMLEPDRMEQLFDMTNRSQEIRYTKWIYGTNGEIEDLFVTTPFFMLSPLHSLLHEPLVSYKQISFIQPTQFNDFIIHYREKAATVILPSLAISSANWSEDMRQHPILEIDGAYLLKDKINKGWLKREDLLGIRWIANSKANAPLVIGPKDDPIGSVKLQKPHSSIKLLSSKDGMSYRIRLKILATVQGVYKENITITELQRMTEETLRKELLATFQKSAALHADPYQLSLKLYQRNPKLWRKLNKDEETITQKSLDIDVKVDLRFWGQRKRVKR